jgi:hypothetical protein
MFVDSQGRVWADEFREILSVLNQRSDLRELVCELLAQAMPGKVTEGGTRLDTFRGVITELVSGAMTLTSSYEATELRLPRHTSPHSANNRVFASGWGERLVRTQLSRLYNQAVLMALLASGETKCFVPHSSEEDSHSQCSRLLAGQAHDAATLLNRIVQCYTMENWTRDVKIPDHPHCTHVVRPVHG